MRLGNEEKYIGNVGNVCVHAWRVERMFFSVLVWAIWLRL